MSGCIQKLFLASFLLDALKVDKERKKKKRNLSKYIGILIQPEYLGYVYLLQISPKFPSEFLESFIKRSTMSCLSLIIWQREVNL
jgi:hypothetical protein